jgi:hypothetical protein
VVSIDTSQSGEVPPDPAEVDQVQSEPIKTVE